METKVSLKTLQLSSSPGSLMASNASNNASYIAPTTGADHLWFYDDSASLTKALTLGSGLSITGTTITATAVSGYSEVQEEGTPVTTRTKLNFVGSAFTAADDAGNSRTNITVATILNTIATAGAVSLSTDVTGDLPYTSMEQLAGLSVLGRSTNSTGDMAAITAGSDHQVLRRSGTSVDFGAIDLSQTAATTNALPETRGGTNTSTYTTGDILYASATDTLSKLPIGTNGNYLKVVAGIPGWAALASTDISDLTETVQDIVGDPSFLVEGDGMTITYNDVSNTLTLAAANIYNSDGEIPNGAARSISLGDNTSTITFINSLASTLIEIADTQVNFVDGVFTIGANDISATTSAGVLSLDASEFRYNINDGNALIQDSRVTTLGLQYAADYSADFTDRSLVDKGTMDAAITAALAAEISGIYEGSGTIPNGTIASVELGGTFNLNYDGGEPAIQIDDTAEALYLNAKGGTTSISLDQTTVLLYNDMATLSVQQATIEIDADYLSIVNSDGTTTPPKLRLYEAPSNGTSYADLQVTTLTANRTIELPDADGTLLIGTGLAGHVALWTADGVLDYDAGITYSAADNAINVSNMGIGVAYSNLQTEPIQIQGSAAAGAQGKIFRFTNSGGSYAGSIGYANNPSDLAFISRTGSTVFDLAASTLQLYQSVTHGSGIMIFEGRADVPEGGVKVMNRASGQGTPGTYPLFVVTGVGGQAADLQQWKQSTTVKSIVDKDGYFVIGGTSLDATAALQVDSTTKGILFPRMTTTERDAISSPPDGLTLYNTTTDKFTVRANGSWSELGTGGGSYTDEEAQDAVGTILVDGTTIDFTYSDATPSITAEVKSNSVSNTYLTSGTGGIYKGSGTIASGAVATVTASSLFKINYSTANPAVQVDDSDNSTTIFSDSGSVYAYINDNTIDLRSTIINIGGGTTAADLRFLEPSGSGSNYTAFKAQAQASDITYTLPATNADGYMKNTSGTLSWDSTGIILNGGNTNGATVTIGTNDAQSLVFETNNTAFMTTNSSGNVGIGTTPGGMRLAVSLTDSTSTSGTPIGMQVKLTQSPGSNSSASARSLTMAAYYDAAGINFTGSPQAAWFENRVINAGNFTSNLYGIYTSGLLMGSDAVTIGTVTNTAAINCVPITSFSNTVSGTVTKAIGVLVANSAKASLTLTNQVGVNVSALSAGTNNTALLMGTNTAPSGNYAIYSAGTEASYFAGSLASTALTLTSSVAATNSVTDMLTIQTNSTGTASTGFGNGILFQGESSTTDNRDMARIAVAWTTATDATREAKIGFQLGDTGGALAEIANFNVSGSNSGQLSVGNSSAVTLQNSALTTATSFTVGNSSQSLTLGGSSGAISVSTSSTSSSAIVLNPSSNNVAARIAIGTTTNDFNFTSGEKSDMVFLNDYVPTSGTGIFNSLVLANQINQTGGANGITRGIYLNQTLTAVADFRAIEIACNETDAKGVYQTGADVKNTFVGSTGFGATTAPTDKVEITGNLALLVAGNKIKIATGSNASLGTATLVAGTVTVNTTAVTSSSKIFLTHGVAGGTLGILSVGTITNATSFVINSSSGTDTSDINWLIIN